MKKITVLCSTLLFLLISSSQAQTIIPSLEFKVQYMESDDLTWGVYVRPTIGFEVPSSPLIGVGQITLVLPNNMEEVQNINSVTGTWKRAAEQIKSPIEAPDKNYFFVGLNNSSDNVVFENDKEALLFTFQLSTCPDTLGLIDNKTDPFNQLPNSQRTNPGMDLGVFNPQNGNIYNWKGNYDPMAFSCAAITTPTKEAQLLDLLHVYPNPSQESLTLEWTATESAQFSIINLTGQVLLQNQDLEAAQTIDISHFSDGIYLIKIISNGDLYYSKFSK